MDYMKFTGDTLANEISSLVKSYEGYKAMGLSLNMARGKPSPEQLDLSMGMLDCLTSKDVLNASDGTDCRNYGGFDGIPECKEIFAKLLGVETDDVFVGGNSSLNMMFDTISTFMTSPLYEDTEPWLNVQNRKFLCPVPG